MDWSRFKYQLRAILPIYWHRQGEFDEEWDNELWNLIKDNQIHFVGNYVAHIGKYQVWISNYPYASGDRRMYDVNGSTCSRATAIYLNQQLKSVKLIQRLKFTKEEQDLYFVRKFPQY